MLYIYFMSRADGCANSSADSAGNTAVAVVQRAPQVTVKGAGRRASRVLAAALSAIALSDDAAGSATTGPLTANGETETHAHGFVALALSYAVPLLARVLPEAYIFTMFFEEVRNRGPARPECSERRIGWGDLTAYLVQIASTHVIHHYKLLIPR